ncbi:sensor histidine kinase [Nocardioides dongkuii]|uniref:sensor histidine kinase n=1 Tax=Nocardioides dongkuii TaxID=2760089 RepID=UPI001FD3BADB|nr:sensor histidine kinase [Nocardioides dongkuii]
MPDRDRAVDLAVDLGIAAALAAAMLVEARLDDSSHVGGAAVAVIVLAALPVLWRRTHPVAALVACFGALFLLETVIAIHQTIPFPSMVVGYTLARRLDRGAAIVLGLVLGAVVLVNLAIVAPHIFFSWETPKNLAFVALPLVVAVAARNRQDYLDALVDRAETAERTREEEARRRVDEERLRIARDLHDVVAHALVAINVQAGVAAHVRDPDPETNRATFREIKRVSGEALGELRTTLGMLREVDEQAPVAPAAGLAGLEDLRRRLLAAGVEVELSLDPAVGTLPPTLDATAYRVLQEALTNVMRHVGPTTVRVEVTRADGALRLRVEDDGPAGDRPPSPRSGAGGHGVRGMGERVRALGGTLSAGPRPEGGWLVTAALPVPVPVPAATPATPATPAPHGVGA